MRDKILKATQEERLNAVRDQLVALQGALGRFPATKEDSATLQEAIRHMTELFLLVVVGEFNSGKSVFVNALLGEPLLEEGVIPTTFRIQIVRHGERLERQVEDESTEVVTAPIGLLQQLQIVDTPGTNAIDRKHEAITREFIPRADLVFFVTSADRPFTESERVFLTRIREWGKKVVLVVNKVDILDQSAEVERIQTYVRRNASTLLGLEPVLFSISARAALRAKMDANGAIPDSFADLERYVTETLDEQERVRLKLLSPLGVGEHLIGRYLAGVEEQEQILQQDLAAIGDIDRQLAVYESDMLRDFRLRLSDVDNVLHQLELRGQEYIEDVIRLPRVFDLLNKSKLKNDFVRKVVADAPGQVEKRVNDIIDWLVSSDLQQWQVVKDYLAKRRSERAEQSVGEFSARFDFDRGRLIETVGRAAQRVLEDYDRDTEANRMAESVQGAVANTALLEVGAVGLGTVVSLLATSTAADVTGILAAGVLATLGFLVLPYRRRAANKELRSKIAALREQLMKALDAQFTVEVQRSLSRLRDSLAPYTRFVRAEEQNLQEKRADLTAIRQKMSALRVEIEEAS